MFYADLKLDIEVVSFKATMDGELMLLGKSKNEICDFVRSHYSVDISSQWWVSCPHSKASNRLSPRLQLFQGNIMGHLW